MSRRPLRFWSLDERLVFSLIGLVLTVVLVALILGLVVREQGKRKLASTRQAMERDGTYRTLEETTTPPAEDALAGGQALLQTVDELRAAEKSGASIGNGLATMRFLAPGVAVPAVAEAMPAMDAPEEKSMNWPDLQTEMEKVRPILTSAETILRGPVGFAYDYRSFKGSDDSAIQKFLVWWRTDALLKLRGGDISGAIDCIENLARISRLMGDSDTLVAVTLEMGIWSYGLQGLLWEILQSKSLTDSDLARLDAIVRSPGFLKDVLRALEIEVAMMPFVYAQVKAAPDTLSAYDSAPAGLLGRETALEIRNNLWPLLWADADQALNLAEWDLAIRNARTLRTQTNYRAAVAAFSRTSRTFSNADIWRFPVVASFSASQLSTTLLKSMTRVETVRQITLTAIALKRYHLKNHAYPETLQSLVPDYTPSVPVDYFDGTPLKYERLQNDEFLLYSVGDNGLDEKGDPTPVKGKPNLATGKDYVWPKVQKPVP